MTVNAALGIGSPLWIVIVAPLAAGARYQWLLLGRRRDKWGLRYSDTDRQLVYPEYYLVLVDGKTA